MEPILRGQIKLPDDGRTIWEGRWGMTSAAFEDSTSDQLNTFRYTSASRVNFITGDTISFKGYFEVTSANKGSKSQFTDKSLDMEVESEDAESGLRTVTGKGSNRFGNFELHGTFNPSTNVLEVRRVYGARPVLVQRMITRKVTEEETTATAPSNDKVKPSSQPQSPSSPAEVQHATSPKAPQKVEDAAVLEQPQIPIDAAFYPEARSVLRELKAKDTNKWFSTPVDAEALGLRDYRNVVKTPMDLGTIQTKMDAKGYATWDECLADMRLTFVNALMYNPRSSLVYKAASDLNLYLDDRVKRVVKGRISNSESNLSASTIGKRLQKKKKFFEPGDLQGPAAAIVSIKKTPKSAKASSGAMTATTQPTKKSKKITISLTKRIKLSEPLDSELGQLILDPIMDVIPVGDRKPKEDEDDVDSFAELDRDDAEVYLTPPATYEDAETMDETPFSNIPLIGEYNAYGGAMSPTNLGDAEDF